MPHTRRKKDMHELLPITRQLVEIIRLRDGQEKTRKRLEVQIKHAHEKDGRLASRMGLLWIRMNDRRANMGLRPLEYSAAIKQWLRRNAT